MATPNTSLSPEQLAHDAIARSRQNQGQLTPLRNVVIEEFRGIRYLAFELDPNVTVFFGVNASGKTTILDAIAIGLGAFVTQFPRAKGVSFAKRGDVRVPWVDRDPAIDASASQEDPALITERRGVERPFARITIHSSSVFWDVTKLRWKGESARKPAHGAKLLRQFLEPLILDALERGDVDAAVQEPIPLVAAYGTERAVVRVPLKRRRVMRSV